MNEFFHMGGYAVYVWSAYGVTALLLLGLIVWTFITLKQCDQELVNLESLSPRRRRRNSAMEGPNAKS
jgi:heme exporter protein D